jgi:phospholipase/lecithinase/hemolysin
METKNKIGALVVLGGIALLGLYWFKKNKPTTSSSQAKGLQALSNYYQTGSGGFEETYIKGQGYTPPQSGNITIGGVPQSIVTNLDYTSLTPKQLEDLKKSMAQFNVSDYSSSISSQIAQGLQNVDFSSLSNLGLTGVTFNVPKK